VFRYYSCLMLATAVVGAVLSIIASGTLLLALGLVMLRIGSGGLSAIWMSQHEKRLTPEKIRQGLAEVRECRAFALSLPLDYPGGTGLNANRLPPAVRPNLRQRQVVRDGEASEDDVDREVREALGLRWTFKGPLETVDLNTRGGIESHAQKMGPAYARMGAQRGQNDPWTLELVQRVAAERRSLIPLADWEARVAWRDEQLINLIHFKEEANP
jgi:ADP-ribose pyrophosphatase YjhB (NUDIX family)